jgi:hypothetical protein
MKGLLLAGASFLFLNLLTAVTFRLYSGKRYYRVLIVDFLVTLAGFMALHRATPPDLGFLGADWLEPDARVDLVVGALVLALLFHSFWNTVYIAFGGFSANLMILLDRDPSLTAERFISMFGADREVDQVLEWRLPNLVQGNYLEPHGSAWRVRPKGRFLGTFVRVWKILLTGADRGG